MRELDLRQAAQRERVANTLLELGKRERARSEYKIAAALYAGAGDETGSVRASGKARKLRYTPLRELIRRASSNP